MAQQGCVKIDVHYVDSDWCNPIASSSMTGKIACVLIDNLSREYLVPSHCLSACMLPAIMLLLISPSGLPSHAWCWKHFSRPWRLSAGFISNLTGGWGQTKLRQIFGGGQHEITCACISPATRPPLQESGQGSLVDFLCIGECLERPIRLQVFVCRWIITLTCDEWNEMERPRLPCCRSLPAKKRRMDGRLLGYQSPIT